MGTVIKARSQKLASITSEDVLFPTGPSTTMELKPFKSREALLIGGVVVILGVLACKGSENRTELLRNQTQAQMTQIQDMLRPVDSLFGIIEELNHIPTLEC